MPANLPPEYYKAEEHYKAASTPQEKIRALEHLISTVPKHKGTDKIRADLRRKLSRLRDDSEKKKRTGKGDLYVVEKQGAAQVCLVGFPNSGKSSLLSLLTNAKPVIADYPMSTVMPLSGMLPYEDIQFQIVDLPPLGHESTDGWVSGIIRYADLLLLVIDCSDDPGAQYELLIEQFKEWRIPVLLGEERTPGDAWLSAKPLVIAANKTDLPVATGGMEQLKKRLDSHLTIVPVSAADKSGVEAVRRAVFDRSGIIRVYAKQPGKKPDMSMPFTLPSGSDVLVLAQMIHKDFVARFRYACIWGSAKFDGQRVQKDYTLKDRDIVEFHLK